MSLQSLLIGRLQALEELLRLPPEVTVEAPVASARRRKTKSEELDDAEL